MATAKMFLDMRYSKPGCDCRVKISVTHNGGAGNIMTDVHVLPEQWSAKERRVVKHPQKAALNRVLMCRYAAVTAAIAELEPRQETKRMKAGLRDKIVHNLGVRSH